MKHGFKMLPEEAYGSSTDWLKYGIFNKSQSKPKKGVVAQQKGSI